MTPLLFPISAGRKRLLEDKKSPQKLSQFKQWMDVYPLIDLNCSSYFFFFQVETIRGKTETGNKAITKLKQEDKSTNANIKVQIYSLSGHGRFISAHTLTTFS